MTDEMTLVEETGTPHPGPLPIASQRGEGEKVKWTEHPLVDALPEFRKLSDEEFADLAAVCGPEAALAYHAAREKRIADAERDPYRWEFPLWHWPDLEAEVLRHIVTFVPGGNNPGKSRWAASFAVRVLTRRVQWDGLGPDGRVKVLMIAQDDGASKMFQQDKVYAQLPCEWRKMNEQGKKPQGFAKSINYSDRMGFTENCMVLPRPLRGSVWFKTVAQYTREPQSFEGPDYDLVIIDEGCPLGLFRALLSRVAKRGGKIVYLLTCVHGYDQTMGQGLQGAKLVQSLPMRWRWGNGDGGTPSLPGGGFIDEAVRYPELKLKEHQSDMLKRMGCPAGEMPYKMQPMNPHWRVVFMWNVWNPFQPPARWGKEVHSPQPTVRGQRWWGNGTLPAQMDACVGDPRWKVLVKMFGWVERMGQLAIGNFNPEVHVVRGEAREKLDQMIRDGKATIYMASDPETQRSHAILWQATFGPCPQWPKGLKFLFDESPRMNEGEWVNANGERGEGQYAYKATGANWYKKYIRAREEEWGICDLIAPVTGCRECVMARRGDPRGFATEESTAAGVRSMFNLYEEDHSDEDPMCGPMVFEPAKIRRASSLDIDGLIDLFRYDEERYRKEGGFTAENTPARLVSERCENWIRCALNYTLTDLGKADEDNPNRDFIDADRYLNSGETPFIDMDAAEVVGGGGWGAR
jgi:hypothetical protein